MRIAVVGAGLAGLAAGCELAEQGHAVTVFERRPWAGGKTYSFADPDTGEQVDNGQHVFMACTTAYIAFLERLGTLHLTRRQKRMRVAVFDGAGRRSDLRAEALPSPFHLLRSFLGYGHLDWRQKIEIARALAAMRGIGPEERAELENLPCDAWLRSLGQSDRTITAFWDFLLLPTLNCRTERASAGAALFVIQEGFLKSSTAAAIGVSRVGLSKLHVDPAIAYIEARGGEVRTRSHVSRFDIIGSRAAGIVLGNGTREGFDAFVCAVPHQTVAGLLPPEIAMEPPFVSLQAIPVSPIVNLHVWFDRPVADFNFAAFTGSELQWAFNRTRLAGGGRRSGEQHIDFSFDGAMELMRLDKRGLIDRVMPLIHRALPATATANVVRFDAIKEPDATFVPAPGIIRPGAETPLENLVLAGAYTDTGWPATMESAVRSGLTAARHLHTYAWTTEALATAAR